MAPSRFLLAAVLPLALAGCGSLGGDISRTFGLTRESPDEFQVTTRAPLSMPPDYTLRPPRPGAVRPQEESPRRAAEAALAPQSVLAGQSDAAASPGQQALVAAAGPPAPSDIRREVDSETAAAADNRGFVDTLMFWRKPQDKSVVVDAQRESQRLRNNAALGESPTTGDTPIIQRKKSSLWNSIF